MTRKVKIAGRSVICFDDKLMYQKFPDMSRSSLIPWFSRFHRLPATLPHVSENFKEKYSYFYLKYEYSIGDNLATRECVYVVLSWHCGDTRSFSTIYARSFLRCLFIGCCLLARLSVRMMIRTFSSTQTDREKTSLMLLARIRSEESSQACTQQLRCKENLYSMNSKTFQHLRQ